jgi:hypothetical protein
VGVQCGQEEDEGEKEKAIVFAVNRSQMKGKEPPPLDEEPEPDLGGLGTLVIGAGGLVAKAQSDAFRSVSPVDRERKLLVCRRWDATARSALARGIAIMLLPEWQEG